MRVPPARAGALPVARFSPTRHVAKDGQLARRPQPAPPSRQERDPRPFLRFAGPRGFLPLDNDLQSWLRDAEAEAAAETAPSNGPSVLVLNSVSRNLAESDLYRIARQGDHVDGWANGLVTVAQSCEPVTQQPQGQYFLFFETRAAAAQYLDDAELLHRRAWSALPVEWRRAPQQNQQKGAGPPPVPDLGSPAGPDPVQGFTLLAPDAALRLHIYDAAWLWHELALHAASVRHARSHEGAAAETIFARVGRRAAAPDRRSRVLVSLEGCGMTAAALRTVLADDGRRRNLPWALDMGTAAVEPVAMTRLVPKATARDGVTETNSPEYTRHVLAFADPVEARRFARQWHRRTMRDQRTGMAVVVNARALW